MSHEHSMEGTKEGYECEPNTDVCAGSVGKITAHVTSLWACGLLQIVKKQKPNRIKPLLLFPSLSLMKTKSQK